MEFSRRETLAGVAGCIGLVSPIFASPVTAGDRLPLVPLNLLRIADTEGPVHLTDFLRSFSFGLESRPLSKEREKSALLSLHRSLLNDCDVHMEHLESLSAKKRAQLQAMAREVHRLDFDDTFCRWVDDEVCAFVEPTWAPQPTTEGLAKRAAKALDDEAVRLHFLGRDTEAVQLCEDVIRLFGRHTREGLRAYTNKTLWEPAAKLGVIGCLTATDLETARARQRAAKATA